MDQAIIICIAGDLGMTESSVVATTVLLEAGATPPFIARYRKELSGSLDEIKVRMVEERLVYYREIFERRAALVKMLAEQNKLTDELKMRINSIFTKVELEDLFHLYKPRRKSRAAEAQEKGLEPLADFIWGQEPDAWSLEEHADVCINAEKQVASREQALLGATDIIAEWIAENLEIRSHLREMLWREGNLISTVVPAKAGQKTKYNMYYDRREPVTTVPSHRVLAIRRGTKEGVLTSAIECDSAKAIEYILSSVVRDRESPFAPVIGQAVRDAYGRILKPLIETEVRAMLKERADREAIRVFQENLSNLLLTPAAGGLVVLGVDIGKTEECRLAVVDERGNLLEEAAISLRAPRPGPSLPQPVAPPVPVVAEEPVAAAMADAPPTAAYAVTETAQPEEAPAVMAPIEVFFAEPEPVEPHEAPSDIEGLPTLEAVPDKPAEVHQEVSTPLLEAAPAAVESTPAEPEIAPPEITPSTVEETAVPDASPVLPVEQVPADVEETQPGVEVGIHAAAEVAPAPVPAIPAAPSKPATPRDISGAKLVLKDLIRKHSVKAIAVGSNSTSRNLETLLRQILAEEALEGIFIAAVNDAGIAIYASSRVAREELPELNVSTRCAVSLARRLQDPLSELVKVDPKLIGVGQYQHDVDQKELHRGLLQTVRSCVNNVGADPNTAGPSLLRYIAGFNDKMARKVLAARNSSGPFRSRAALLSVPGMDQGTFEQSAGFLRIRDAENPIDRSAIHLECYPIVEKMAQSLGVGVAELFGNRDLVSRLRLEDFVTDKAGLPTLKDLREELLRPGRDPRRTFAMPKFRPDVKDIGDLKEGMALEGTVTNVTNFGAFVDIGVRQDGLVHLSQMSNRFIRDPREAVKVGDVVNVKVISVEPETKRIGLSIKALLPAIPRRRKKVPRRGPRPTEPAHAQAPPPEGNAAATDAPAPQVAQAADPSRPPIVARRPEYGRRDNRVRRPESSRRSPRPRGDGRERRPSKVAPVPVTVAADPVPPEPEEPKGPEPTLQEKIALLQSKFKGIS